MQCSISGEPATVPVVSPKSGCVFERALIEAYIRENGTDPITGDALDADTLIEIKTAGVVRPRPPNLTSIPALLTALQSEWEAVTLEAFRLKKQLQDTRRELSSALYFQDAAVRVASRLTKERDEARQTLAQLEAGLGNAKGNSQPDEPMDGHQHSDAMDDKQDEPMDESKDGAGKSSSEYTLSPELVQKIDTTKEHLVAERRARKKTSNWLPPDWLQAEELARFSKVLKTKQLFGSVAGLHVNGDRVLLGGAKGAGAVFSIAENKVMTNLKASGIMTAFVWLDAGSVAVGTKTGAVQVFDASTSEQISEFEQDAKGGVLALKLLPVGSVLVSVSSSGWLGLHDLTSGQTVASKALETTVTALAVHPDGKLMALGSTEGQILILDVLTGSEVHTFQLNSAVTALEFSENGVTLASACEGSPGAIQLWSLGKMNLSKELKLETLADTSIVGISLDWSAKFLLAVGATGGLQVAVNENKTWLENAYAVPGDDLKAVAAGWGANARSIITTSAKGSVCVLAASEN